MLQVVIPIPAYRGAQAGGEESQHTVMLWCFFISYPDPQNRRVGAAQRNPTATPGKNGSLSAKATPFTERRHGRRQENQKRWVRALFHQQPTRTVLGGYVPFWPHIGREGPRPSKKTMPCQWGVWRATLCRGRIGWPCGMPEVRRLETLNSEVPYLPSPIFSIRVALETAKAACLRSPTAGARRQ